MRIVFIGAVKFSSSALRELIAMGADVAGVCTLQSSAFNSDHEDLTPLAKSASIPVSSFPDINSHEAISWIKSRSPDVIFCFGWSHLVRKQLLAVPPLGVIGFHPSALPANRGRHPIVWALVLGLQQTASTFFMMDEYADSGDIVSQEFLDISCSDDASILYNRITITAMAQIREFVPQLANGTIQLLSQNSAISNEWRKRRPTDGIIDWRMAASSVHNLVRGLTRPYIGAHFEHNGQIVKVWKTEIVLGQPPNFEPGKIIEVSNYSPVIKTGIDAIRLLDYSPRIPFVTGAYI